MATLDDSESKACGILNQLEDGMHTLLALVTGRHVFGVTDALSCSLQSLRATVCGSMEAVQHSLAQLRRMRSENSSIKYGVILRHKLLSMNCATSPST